MSSINVINIKHPSASGNAITLAADGSAFINTGVLGIRNRIINGDMRIDQRNAGASQTITAGNNTYTVDRWFALSTGANVTGQRIAGAVANTFRYQISGAASVSNVQFVQRIEAINSADLAGKTIAVSFDMANSLLTTVQCRLSYAGGTDNWALATTEFYTGNVTISSTVTRYNFTVNLPAAATTGLQLNFSVGSQTSGTWTIGDVQLEAGSVNTPMERRSYGQELALCQRYYQLFNSGAGAAYPTSSGANAISAVNFIQTMRASPTVTLGAVTANNNGLSDDFSVQTPTSVGCIYRVVQAGAAGNFWLTRNNNTASAEL